MAIKLYNTLTGKLEEFTSIKPNEVKMYNCGPTVYGIQHIGNLSMFVFTDTLRRTLEYHDLDVKQVINITDFGHLTSDADEGEDKMTKGLRNEGLSPTLENMQTLAHKYGEIFLDDIKKLNIKTKGTLFPYASQYLENQIELIKTLEKKHFTYQTSDGIYFDVSMLGPSNYGKLGGLQGLSFKLDNQSGLQSRVGWNSEKRNQRDFALWKFNNELGFPSKWGQGFPGWHIECSAMIINILGEQIDIHTGGIEHIPVHHNNEIAQAEAATGKEPFARYWLHRAHLQISGEKVAKSEGNVVYLSQIIEKGFSALAYRYFLLMAHYRTPVSFSWEALGAAENAYRKLKEVFAGLTRLPDLDGQVRANGRISENYKKEFSEAIENDLNTPEALSVVWKLVKDKSVSPADKQSTLLNFDQVLGLDFENNEFLEIPQNIVDLGKKRKLAKDNQDFKEADKIRGKIENQGFEIRDTGDTFVIFKR